MTIKIEEWKCYRDRKGDKVGPMRARIMVDGQRSVCPFISRGVMYNEDGRSVSRDNDIVAEWAEDQPQPQPSTDGGDKFDDGKTPYHLLPVDALQAITEILDFGAKKYAPRNWEKGLDWSRVYRAALGHLFDWWRGAGPDAETGKSHLWHAGCCVMFLIAYEMRGVGKDDRPV